MQAVTEAIAQNFLKKSELIFMLIEELKLHAAFFAKNRDQNFLMHELLIKPTFAVSNHELRHRYFVNINILVLHTRDVLLCTKIFIT